MKKILLLWLFSGSLDCFCQNGVGGDVKWSGTLKMSTGIIVYSDSDRILTPKPDTISAMIQVSANRPMRVTYGIPGYVVLMLGADPAYLNRNKQPLDSELIVWRWVKYVEQKRKRRAKQ